MFFKSEFTDPLNLANYYAKRSCSKWNRSSWEPKTIFGGFYKVLILDSLYRFSRWYFRMKLWEMAQAAWESGDQKKWMDLLENYGPNVFSSYPWPYCDHKFADWDKEPDSLVLDPSGCVIKDSTSYCAWKIYECTGAWPNKNLGLPTGAKNWRQFLREAGYMEVANQPDYGASYVGINPNDGEDGIVVWFESLRPNGVVTSTYRKERFSVEIVENVEDYVWIKIT